MSPESTLIREAARRDMEGLVALAEAERDDPEMPERVELDLRTADRVLFVALAGTQVVGYGRAAYFEPPGDSPANVAPAGYYLSGLLVSAAWRRCGLGERLTQVRLAWVFRRVREVWYFANVRNHASLALHEKLGFVEITRDFIYPGVTFEGGVGVLARAADERAGRRSASGA